MDGDNLLTKDQVRAWVAERDDVARQHSALAERLEDLDRKLAAISFLLPSSVVEGLLAPEIPTKPRAEMTFVEMVADLLRNQPGGRSPSWIRTQLRNDPEVGHRVHKSANGVSNALSRMLQKGEVAKEDGLYYLPSLLESIRKGETNDEHVETVSDSFNQTMHRAMEAVGGPFNAGQAIEIAKSIPELAIKINEQPSRVYSWLSREVFRGKLVRVGEGYTYPGNENGPPEGGPDAGGVAAPSSDSRIDFDSLNG